MSIKYINVQGRITQHAPYFIYFCALSKKQIAQFSDSESKEERKQPTSVETDKILKILHQCCQRNLLH